jgi:hypothetical protein
MRAPGAEAEVVAHQHVARPQAVEQHVVDEVVRRARGQAGVEGQHDGLRHAAGGEFAELVAQGADARGRELGPLVDGGEVVARMRLEGQHAAGQAALARLGVQERQHGLMTTVDAVEIADGQRAGRCHAGMPEPTKNLHGSICF